MNISNRRPFFKKKLLFIPVKIPFLIPKARYRTKPSATSTTTTTASTTISSDESNESENNDQTESSKKTDNRDSASNNNVQEQKTSTESTEPISANCSPPSINDFPTDLFSQTQRRFGAIIFHVIFAVYLFLSLLKVCDDYFMPSLEIIGQVRRILLQHFNFKIS